MNISPCRARWKSAMTDRQRFAEQMHFRPVDRCFNMEFGYWKDNFKQWPIFRDNGITSNDEAHQFFNFDRIEKLEGNIWIWPPFEPREVERRERTRLIQNADGLLAEVPLDEHDTVPHFVQSPIAGPDDWRRFKAERLDADHPQRRVDVEAMRARHPADRDYPLGVHCGSMIGKVRDLLTFEGIAYAIYDFPDMVEDMVETACQLVLSFLDQVLGKIEFDYASGWEDICFNLGPIVGVDFFRRVVVPRYKRIRRRLEEHGVDVWYTDCDGDVRPIVPHLLEGGVNCAFPWEVNGSGHPGAAIEKHGRNLLMMGGVDKMQLGRGQEAIKAYLESLAPWVARGGFIPFCDHRCPPNVKVEDYLYYLDLKEEMFGMG
ncbi:MAG: Uroporphyrinogen decarboxylase (URO-D) [Planctomycetes bacterium ADurb.Bin126]|nr:MAG: Uroporphyrinogen decarboxylase (URO-D) [Planctomycetes bacterium ADurb.Bin126]